VNEKNEKEYAQEKDTLQDDEALDPTDTEEGASDEETPKSEAEKLQEALAEAQAQATEYLDGWQRTQAEFANYKKRQAAERIQITAMANANLLRKLFAILDDFERATKAMPEDFSQATWFEGIELIQQKLKGVIKSEGVEPIDAEGALFDPRYHEAVTYEEVAGYEEGQIIEEIQRGYVLGERVLRPALVRVAKAPSSPEENEQDESTVESAK
jgi:molecular chaperone GrpE